MKTPWWRWPAAVLFLIAAIGGPLVPVAAHAGPVATGSLKLVGDPGDWLLQGKTYSYSTGNGDGLSAEGSPRGVNIGAKGWFLTIRAPSQAIPGTPASLVPGTFAHTLTHPGTGPGLDLTGDGRSCPDMSGSFTIIKAVFGPNGYVQTFDATFDWYCGAKAHGEVHIANPPAPAGSSPSPQPTPSPPPTTGTVKFKGDPGESLTQGKSYSFATNMGDRVGVAGDTGNEVRVFVTGYRGDDWTVEFSAPRGQHLAPGTYSSAHRFSNKGTGPGFELHGNGHACGEANGSFTIINAVTFPNGYVQTFDATFEQHCEAHTAAVRGEVHTSRPPPPSASPSARPTANLATPRPSGEVRSLTQANMTKPLVLIGVGMVAWVAVVLAAFGIYLAIHSRGRTRSSSPAGRGDEP